MCVIIIEMAKKGDYDKLVGSRAEVMHGTAYKTSGGLTKNDLKYNKSGSIVSKKKSSSAKRDNRLVKAGYKTKKGVFGFVKDGEEGSKKKRSPARRGKSPRRGRTSPRRGKSPVRRSARRSARRTARRTARRSARRTRR
jgi:hypothetical protein